MFRYTHHSHPPSAVFELLQPLVRAIQPLLVPICFVCAWVLMILTIWSIWTAMRDTMKRSQKMHQVPCADCQFFTSDYHLKCTVHPAIALSEDAIDCPDYQPEKTALLQ